MTQLTVIATIVARPGDGPVVREALLALMPPTRAEEGCLRYDLHEDPDDPARFVFYETWESTGHLERHLESAHIVANRDRMGPHIESLTIQRLARVELE